LAVGKVTISSIAKLTGYLWDTHVTGFGARKQTNGTFYYVRYRHNGQQVVRSLGRHGPLTPDTARSNAKQLLGTVASGVDPFANVLAGEGFAIALDRYLERKRTSLRAGSFRDTERYLRQQAAPLHRLSLAQVDRRKVAALLGDIETSSGPVSRNRARSALSSFFAWAIAEGLVDVNPVSGTAKANEAASRERVLSADELRQLWLGLGNDPFSDVVRLLLLTGQRRDEIGELSWSEIDLVRKQITLPPSRTKNGREHTLPLPAQALKILEAQRRRNSSVYLFGERGFNNWSFAKAALDRKVALAPFRLHDLRRTCATQMAELGVQPSVIEMCLNHVSGSRAGVAGIYNRSKLTDAVREGLQRWADHLDQIVAG
jgi:integrase